VSFAEITTLVNVNYADDIKVKRLSTEEIEMGFKVDMGVL
jgi:hypothetical protein